MSAVKKERIYVINIYKITNKVNGKIYIGRTKKPIEKRLKEHCWGAMRREQENNYFRRAIRKYGKENFSVELLEQCSFEVSHEREIHYIRQFNSLCDEIGYNTTWVSAGSNGDIQLATRLKLGDASKKYWSNMTSEERSNVLSKRMTGIRRSDEHKKKISLEKRGVKRNGKSNYNGVFIRNNKIFSIFYYSGGSIETKCNSEEEAAKLWDTISYVVYGPTEKFNYPNDLNRLSKKDLIELLETKLNYPKSKYNHISVSKRGYEVWNGRKFISRFKTESDALLCACKEFQCTEQDLLRSPTMLERFESFLNTWNTKG